MRRPAQAPRAHASASASVKMVRMVTMGPPSALALNRSVSGDVV
ncbi:MAG TPA: hypothetical protein VHL80_17350 [Polyangia bacterium]|nr:hypothetical protein [Polyangia bacterium]